MREELQTLHEYVDMFDDMTAAEKGELREWMAHGSSVNNNPYPLYGENGCPMDFIDASRFTEDMAANPEQYRRADAGDGDAESTKDIDLPF